MNATLENYPAAEMRASDADRDAVLSELSEQFQAGRLTAAELDERAGQALAARTWGELRELLRDLPTALAGPDPLRPLHPLRPLESLAATSSAATSSAAPSSAAPSSGALPERPSRRPALLPVAALAGIAIAVAMSVGIAHDRWGFWWLLLSVLFIARRVIWCAGASMRSGPPA